MENKERLRAKERADLEILKKTITQFSTKRDIKNLKQPKPLKRNLSNPKEMQSSAVKHKDEAIEMP
jgi:hypothetical protein